MRLMIDTNILLDVLIHRDDFYDNSKAILKLCEDRSAQGFVSASAIHHGYFLYHPESPRQHRGHLSYRWLHPEYCQDTHRNERGCDERLPDEGKRF